MSNLDSFDIENTVQPITDDFSSDGMLDEFSRVDHQHPLSVSLRNKIEHKYSAIPNVVDSNNNSRGNNYAISHHSQVVPATVGITNVITQVCAVAIPSAPIAGALLDISWQMDLNQTVLGVGFTYGQVYINGVLLFATARAPDLIHQAVWSCRVTNVPSPIGIAYSISFRIATLNAAGNVVAQANYTRLDVVYYR